MVFRGQTLSQKDALDCAIPWVNGAAVDLPAMHFDAIEPRAAPSSGKIARKKLEA
jgi:hypothetical protein